MERAAQGTRNDCAASPGQVPSYEFIAASCSRMHMAHMWARMHMAICGHAAIAPTGFGCRGMPRNAVRTAVHSRPCARSRRCSRSMFGSRSMFSDKETRAAVHTFA